MCSLKSQIPVEVEVEVEVEVAMEDDVLFADINRQISLLIDDEDDNPVAHFPSLPPQIIFTQSTIHPSMMPSSQHMYQEMCTRRLSSKGTGVFIPQWPQLRRKYKEQRKHARSSNNKQLINSN